MGADSREPHRQNQYRLDAGIEKLFELLDYPGDLFPAKTRPEAHALEFPGLRPHAVFQAIDLSKKKIDLLKSFSRNSRFTGGTNPASDSISRQNRFAAAQPEKFVCMLFPSNVTVPWFKYGAPHCPPSGGSCSSVTRMLFSLAYCFTSYAKIQGYGDPDLLTTVPSGSWNYPPIATFWLGRNLHAC